MRVVMRTDSSLQIGTGHVMRCLALAQALRANGASCLFVCRAHPGHPERAIRDQGFDIRLLDAPYRTAQVSARSEALQLSHAEWLGVEWSVDAEQTLSAIGPQQVDWLVVDHYALDARWERDMRSVCCNLMVIDDLADRLHDCDLLVDQNMGRKSGDYWGLVPAKCAVLSGPRFALMRPEFAMLREYSWARRARPALRKILVTMGGVDSADATSQTLEALRISSLADNAQITVVLGSHAPSLGRVQALALGMPWPTEVLVDVNNMAQLMADSDVAIGAAGGTAWERCCLGLPSLLVVLAENQRAGATALVADGAALPLATDNFDAFAASLHAGLTTLLDVERLSAVSSAAFSVTEGLGAQLVAGKLSYFGNKYEG